MSPVYAFTVIMLVWVISDFISKKTKSLISSLFVASLIFLIGFKTNTIVSDILVGTIFEPFANTFSDQLLVTSSLLPLGQTIVGFIIVHLGSMISLEELKAQSKTFAIGVAAVLGVTVTLYIIGPLLKDMNYVIGGIGALTGGTVSIIIVQEAASELGLVSVAAFPVLVAAIQGLVGFPLTSVILRKEANRLKGEYRSGELVYHKEDTSSNVKKRFNVLPFMETTSGTLFWIGVVVLLSTSISVNLLASKLHPFVIALVFGVLLREVGLIKANVLGGIDAFGLMMLGVLIIVFGPLASITPEELIALARPILITFVVGITGNVIFSVGVGKLMKYSIPMSIAIGLTSLYGFPGTMILSQEAAKSVGENEEEIAVIEANILPKMIIAGFATVTITSVVITGFIVQFIA